VLSKNGKKVSTGQAYGAYASLCSRDQIRALTQRRFSDIIGFLDLDGLINARVISKGRYGSTRDIPGSLNGEVGRQLSEGKI
jgi:cell division control protein 6